MAEKHFEISTNKKRLESLHQVFNQELIKGLEKILGKLEEKIKKQRKKDKVCDHSIEINTLKNELQDLVANNPLGINIDLQNKTDLIPAAKKLLEYLKGIELDVQVVVKDAREKVSDIDKTPPSSLRVFGKSELRSTENKATKSYNRNK